MYVLFPFGGVAAAAVCVCVSYTHRLNVTLQVIDLFPVAGSALSLSDAASAAFRPLVFGIAVRERGERERGPPFRICIETTWKFNWERSQVYCYVQQPGARRGGGCRLEKEYLDGDERRRKRFDPEVRRAASSRTKWLSNWPLPSGRRKEGGEG